MGSNSERGLTSPSGQRLIYAFMVGNFACVSGVELLLAKSNLQSAIHSKSSDAVLLRRCGVSHGAWRELLMQPELRLM
ncbi:hypothetical protein NDU88_002995 [Pleurodeles waltl]|uniref:Uncharacterized protein n=1 Tax=Pleurodeles waltl TaxID=8319 RepID=A0AAV7UX83_PLEWA|nr:hypothetical protein NDU88_002995 [Pleurodeles waltl]